MAPPIKYPWDVWLDGQSKTLSRQHGDFGDDVKLSSLARQIRVKALDAGLDINVRLHHPDRLELRFPERDSKRYDWDTLLDGKQHILSRNELTCTLTSFRQYAYAVARERGLAVSVRAKGDLLAIQATGPYRPKHSRHDVSPLGDVAAAEAEVQRFLADQPPAVTATRPTALADWPEGVTPFEQYGSVR